ncbi:MAG: peptidoglycan-associated lipoprotein Pal [Alphaproteobacteria bacterium]
MSVFIRRAVSPVISLPAVLLLAAACSSTPEPETAAVESGAAVQPAGPAPGSPEDFANSVQDRVFFALDRYDLDEGDRQVLLRQAAWLSSNPDVRITVEGHCDERGTREYNMALGAKRANAVKDFLVGQGIEPNRIKVVSYGKERPADPRSAEDAWRLNRRSVTVVKVAPAF